MNGIQKKTMLSSAIKIFRTKNAHMVMSGILKPQIQPRPTPPPPEGAVPPDRLVRLAPPIAFMRLGGTANDAAGLAFFKTLRSNGSGNGTGGTTRPPLSYQAAIRKGSLK